VTGDICLAPIAELRRRYRSRELSPVDVATALVERIDRLNPLLNAYLTVLDHDLPRLAKQAERRLLREDGDIPSLLGIPLSIKDNIATARIRTTAGSRILADWVPDRDAGCVASLRAAGALIVGKTNLFEFAFGEAHDDYGPVRNPWSLDRSTAGSSSGAAAAVAAGLCSAAVATDTGGSIRVPAAFCGTVGLKPTYGRIATDGVVSTSWTMCHVGPIARTVQDTAAAFNGLTRRSTSIQSIDAGLDGVRLALARVQDGERLEPEIRIALESATAALENVGARLDEVELPSLLLARDLLWAIASPEAADIHHDWLATRAADYHPVVRARLERGRLLSAETYVRAQRVRRWLAGQVDALLTDVDALVLPVAAVLPYALGARTVLVEGREEEVSQAVTRYTPLASLTGRPALALPCARSTDGLPIGLQLVGHVGRDEELLAIGMAVERTLDWHGSAVDLTGPILASGRT
jgi:aspartyl-tRNA(Asn)/glutamyl-tRNA(Gln) amidotransferase subunit A